MKFSIFKRKPKLNPDVPHDLILLVADAIEREPQHYDQEVYFGAQYDDDGNYVEPTAKNCGTVACLAGWAVTIKEFQGNLKAAKQADDEGVESYETEYRSVHARARDYMNLDQDDADNLFCAAWKPATGYTVPQALRALADGASIEDVSR